MTTTLRPSAIVPPAFLVDRVSIDGVMATIEARGVGATGQCPDCHLASVRVHSRYQRRLADLPLAGRVVRISLMARRFVACRHRVAEAFSQNGSAMTFWRSMPVELPASTVSSNIWLSRSAVGRQRTWLDAS